MNEAFVEFVKESEYGVAYPTPQLTVDICARLLLSLTDAELERLVELKRHQKIVDAAMRGM